MQRAQRPAHRGRPRRAPRPTGSTPISTTYRGYEVLELPPNTQGVVALEMLNILEGFDLKALGHNSRGVPAPARRGQADRVRGSRRLARRSDAVPPRRARRACCRRSTPPSAARRSIRERAARELQAADARRPAADAAPSRRQARGDTIYLTVADRDGNVVSLIQSIFESFGAGIVAGDTGIALHNRGSLFSLQPGHPERARAGQAAVPHARAGDGA